MHVHLLEMLMTGTSLLRCTSDHVNMATKEPDRELGEGEIDEWG